MEETVNIQGNGVKHASPATPSAPWPPPWLTGPAVESPTPAPAAVALVTAPPAAYEPMAPALAVASLPGGDGCELMAIDPPPPCPTCGSLELWWDPWGTQHCQICQAAGFRRGQRLADLAPRLRWLAEMRRRSRASS